MNKWDEIKNMNDYHITLAWEELSNRFGFNLDYWKKEFINFMGSQPRNLQDTDGFITFGNRRINSVLNSILGRNDLSPTFNNFMCYIIKKSK